MTEGAALTPALQRTFAWCGAGFVLLLFPAIIMTGLLPPMSPMRSADEVAEFWSTDPGVKRLGLVMMLASAGVQAPLGALIAVRIRRMEGRYPLLAYLQLAGCALSVVAILLPTFAFAAASYRPERDPEITQALNDLGWLPFVMNWPAATLQSMTIAFAIFGATCQVWPRWFAYWNLWCAFVFAAGGLVVLFKDGVFAWNGLLAFWMVAVFFGVWFLVLTWQLLATIGSSPRPRHIDVGEISNKY
jgi:hypothetical protein